MMKKKTWTLLCLGCILTGLIYISALVIFIDPFQIYRPAKWYTPRLDSTTQIYSNAGIARHYDYDSIVVGTSMTENFYPSQMDKLLGGRFVKLSLSGSNAYEHALIMDLAFRTQPIRRVVYGLEPYAYSEDPYQPVRSVPMYLYDDCLLNDIRYWLNLSVLSVYIPRCILNWGNVPDESIRDWMYNWSSYCEYGEPALDYTLFRQPEYIYPADTCTEVTIANLRENLIPFITAHPETQFDLFFPPYSAIEWANLYGTGSLDAILNERLTLFDMLSSYENVTIHDFNAREEWVLDLSNYKDSQHHGEWLNNAIVESIAAQDAVVTSREQIIANSRKISTWAHALVDAGTWIYSK